MNVSRHFPIIVFSLNITKAFTKYRTHQGFSLDNGL